MIAWLKKKEWTLVTLTAAVGFLIGLCGFYQFLNTSGKEASPLDFIYFVIRLFLFNYDLPGDGVPYATPNPALEVARFLCPATVFYTGIRGVTVALARNFGLWKIRNWSGHNVIIGGGKRGTELATALFQRSVKTIVVDSDPGCEYLTVQGASQARIITGDIRDADVQHAARLTSAGLVIAVTSSSEINLETVLSTASHNNGSPVRILTHAPRKFSEIFEDSPPFDKQHGAVESRFFSYDSNAARALTLEFAPQLAGKKFQAGSPRILLVGDNAFLAEFVCNVITQFQYAFAGPPQIIVLCDNTEAFDLRLPTGSESPLPLICTVSVVGLPSYQLLRPDIAPFTREAVFDLAFVAFMNDADALHCSRNLSTTHSGAVQQVITCLRPSHNFMSLSGSKSLLPGVEIRNLVHLGCSMAAVVDGSLDAAARAIHERYVAEETAKGITLRENPLLVPWSDLAESYRDSNRSQADNSEVKKQQLLLDKSADCIESMAEAEHRRWMANRVLSGWRFGLVRDNPKRLHPSIVPYSQLSEAEKQKDRDTIKLLLKDIQVF